VKSAHEADFSQQEPPESVLIQMTNDRKQYIRLMLLAQLQQAGNQQGEHTSCTQQAHTRQSSTQASSATPKSTPHMLCTPHDKSSDMCAEVS
jgi:hypothetical protein